MVSKNNIYKFLNIYPISVSIIFKKTTKRLCLTTFSISANETQNMSKLNAKAFEPLKKNGGPR